MDTLTLLLAVADVLFVKSKNKYQSGGLDRFLGYISPIGCFSSTLNKPILT